MDFKTPLQCSFISRASGKRITTVPNVNRISLNKDMTKFTDAFDFDVSFKFKDRIDIRSHDFIEFYFIIDGQRFQAGCGYVEDFVKKTGSSTLSMQGNGRDFLGQTLSVPFSTARPSVTLPLLSFVTQSMSDPNLYQLKYLSFVGVARKLIDLGSYAGPLIIKATSDLMIGNVIQEMADTCQSLVYQNRNGQIVTYGRDGKDSITVPYTLSDVGDQNVLEFTLREDFSKVKSEAKIFYAGAEGNVDYSRTPSTAYKNTEPKAANIYQPHLQVFNQADLVTLDGQYNLNSRKDALAKSILRKSNQNLERVVIKSAWPFYLTPRGTKIPYEINQNWTIKSLVHGLNQPMKLSGIGYTQDPSNLSTELNFVGVDTLV